MRRTRIRKAEPMAGEDAATALVALTIGFEILRAAADQVRQRPELQPVVMGVLVGALGGGVVAWIAGQWETE